MKKGQVILDHDGSVDDFRSLILLLANPEIDILGISITPADCYAENALETTRKILAKAGRSGIAIGVGDFHGINAFPADWRARPKILNAFPSLIGVETNRNDVISSDALMTEKLLTTEEQVTVLMTGPCSNLVRAVQSNMDVVHGIEKVLWMGGAFDVPGNVATYNHDGSAEWNVFWDPLSASTLLEYGLEIVFIPLDVTNQVPVTKAFLKELARHSDSFWADLAGHFWATTLDTIPAYEYIYFMWDVLATSYLTIPDAFVLERMEIDVVETGPSAGRTVRKPGSKQFAQVATKVDKEMFYDYLIEAFTSLDHS